MSACDDGNSRDPAIPLREPAFGREPVATGVALNSVYVVSKHLDPVTVDEIDRLAAELPMPLPAAYSAMLTRFGRGEFSNSLRVHTPEEVREWMRNETFLSANLDTIDSGGWGGPDALSRDDVGQLVVFATSFFGDMFACCLRHGPTVFLLPRSNGLVTRFANGLFDVLNHCTGTYGHAFPFFQPWRDNTTHIGGTFHVQRTLGAAAFLDALRRRWGSDNIRFSRDDGEYKLCFVEPIGGRFDVWVCDKPWLEPTEGKFAVDVVCDGEHVDAVAEFVRMFN